jgi:hypothetical protein
MEFLVYSEARIAEKVTGWNATTGSWAYFNNKADVGPVSHVLARYANMY